MKKLITSATTIGLASLLPQFAQAEGFSDELTWIPQVGIQMKNIEFKQEIGEGDLLPESGDLDVDLPTLSLGLTAAFRKFYLSIKYEDTIGSDVTTDSDVPFTNSDTKVDREDASITLGYNIWGGGNIFLGYMAGETTLEPDPLCPVDPSQVVTDCDEGGFNSGNIAHFQYVTEGTTYQQTYEEDGWFLGGSYGWELGGAGMLSLSLAYADLDATYKDNFLVPFNFEGDADGFSAGISWSAPLTEHVGYYLDLRTQKYEMDTDEDKTGGDGFVKTEETITAFTAGIQWYF